MHYLVSHQLYNMCGVHMSACTKEHITSQIEKSIVIHVFKMNSSVHENNIYMKPSWEHYHTAFGSERTVRCSPCTIYIIGKVQIRNKPNKNNTVGTGKGHIGIQEFGSTFACLRMSETHLWSRVSQTVITQGRTVFLGMISNISPPSSPKS